MQEEIHVQELQEKKKKNIKNIKKTKKKNNCYEKKDMFLKFFENSK